RALTVWIQELKRLNVLRGKVIPKAKRSNFTKGLEGEHLKRRKQKIQEVVKKHNKGEWFEPKENLQRDIDRLLARPQIPDKAGASKSSDTQPLSFNGSGPTITSQEGAQHIPSLDGQQHGSSENGAGNEGGDKQFIQVKMLQQFIPEGTTLDLWIPGSDEGRDSVLRIIGLMRTAIVWQPTEPNGKSTAGAFKNWIQRLKALDVLGGKKIPEGSKSHPMARLTGDDLKARKEMIRKVIEEHNEGIWFTPKSELGQEIKRLVDYKWHSQIASITGSGKSSEQNLTPTTRRDGNTVSIPQHSSHIHIPPSITSNGSPQIPSEAHTNQPNHGIPQPENLSLSSEQIPSSTDHTLGNP
ncbi:hypothetical protein H0H93_014830, partial [Arthromyces matolae]